MLLGIFLPMKSSKSRGVCLKVPDAPSVSLAQVEIAGVSQMSSVHIKRCRYLAESGCAGMCINLCKSPTQVPSGL